MCRVFTIYNRISSIATDFFFTFHYNSIVSELRKMPVGLAVLLHGSNQLILNCCIGLTACKCKYKQITTIIRLYISSSWAILLLLFLHKVYAERILLSKHFRTRGILDEYMLAPHACTNRVITNGKGGLNTHKRIPYRNFNRALRIYG